MLLKKLPKDTHQATKDTHRATKDILPVQLDTHLVLLDTHQQNHQTHTFLLNSQTNPINQATIINDENRKRNILGKSND